MAMDALLVKPEFMLSCENFIIIISIEMIGWIGEILQEISSC